MEKRINTATLMEEVVGTLFIGLGIVVILLLCTYH